MILGIDFETRSTVDLPKSGVYPYAAHPETDVWCMAWAFDDEEPEIWTPSMLGQPEEGPFIEGDSECPVGFPVRIYRHIMAGGEIRAWNAQFERVIWREIMVKRYGAPEIALEQFYCTAADAAAMSLPRSLDKCAKVTGVGEKDADGYSVMMRMSHPREELDDGTLVWWDEKGVALLAEAKSWTPKRIEKELASVKEKQARLHAYCKQDVVTERALSKVIRRIPASEREVYLFDQRVNDRGIRFDRELATSALKIATKAIDDANDILADLTNGEVTKVTQNGRALAWVQSQGLEANSLDKAAVVELLGGDLTENVRAFLETRSEAGRASVSKIKSMMKVAGEDDRLRGLLLYHGASTGRWAGRLVQPHNFPRGEIKNIESYIPWVLDGEYEAINMLAPPVVVISSLLRGMLIPAEGHDLIAADFSAIEARFLNWIADQKDVVELFRKYDAAPKDEKPLYDVYRRNATRLFGVSLDEVLAFPHRQTGKFQELGCGFGMGKKKAVKAAKDVYGLTLTEEQAEEIVNGYRSSHTNVVDLWYESERAVLAAVASPGSPITFGPLENLRALKAGSYLYVILPSRRALCYAQPKIVERMTPWGEMKPCVEVSAENPVTRQWERNQLYGGLIVENFVQAGSRDLLVHGMMAADKVGYTSILSVHDEAVAEVPKGFGSVEEFERILSTTPEWAAGCPVSAEGWRGDRYRK